MGVDVSSSIVIKQPVERVARYATGSSESRSPRATGIRSPRSPGCWVRRHEAAAVIGRPMDTPRHAGERKRSCSNSSSSSSLFCGFWGTSDLHEFHGFLEPAIWFMSSWSSSSF